MIFEFIIIHQIRENEPILDVIRDRLRDALEANLNDVDDDALACMVRVNFQRLLPKTGAAQASAVFGFSIELSEEVASIREVVDDFADAVTADPIEHTVKCEDPLLRAELAARAEELFALEMKLRRVLSIIYLHANPHTDFYDLLSEETVQPMASAKPQKRPDELATAEKPILLPHFWPIRRLEIQRPAVKDLGALIRK